MEALGEAELPDELENVTGEESVCLPGNEVDDGEEDEETSVATTLSMAMCPQCLTQIPLRRTRPANTLYSGGVSCDHCTTQLILDDVNQVPDPAFFHCRLCSFDLCHQCAE